MEKFVLCKRSRPVDNRQQKDFPPADNSDIILKIEKHSRNLCYKL